MAVVHFHNRHTSKNQTVKECIKFHIDYAKNPEKTQNGLLVSAYECSPETAAEEFLISKKMYEIITITENPIKLKITDTKDSTNTGTITLKID